MPGERYSEPQRQTSSMGIPWAEVGGFLQVLVLTLLVMLGGEEMGDGYPGGFLRGACGHGFSFSWFPPTGCALLFLEVLGESIN